MSSEVGCTCSKADSRRTGAQHVTMPCAGYASRVQQGQATFGKYPENLLHSRVRYSKAFKVGILD